MAWRTENGQLSRRQQVLETLRSEIMTGRYEPGERLIEAAISEELGTSRGPVREALRQLEHEGLVVSVPYRGAVVLDVSDEEVQEVLIPIRLTLESFSFAKALELMTEDDFGELAKQLWLMEEGARKNDLQQVVEADLRFHEIVIAGSGRQHTMQVWRSIWPRIRNYFIRYGRFRELDSIVDEHRELLDALRGRDLEQTMAVLERHIAVPVPSSRPAVGEKR
ncbi:MAG TPA: GntR family transcriptional regulator [Gaiellaceae bacterium]|nr:GntR family transcriptional regulator [Gaiellaceae bacterium]